MTDLLKKLHSYIASMAPHQKESTGGSLLIESTRELERLENANPALPQRPLKDWEKKALDEFTEKEMEAKPASPKGTCGSLKRVLAILEKADLCAVTRKHEWANAISEARVLLDKEIKNASLHMR